MALRVWLRSGVVDLPRRERESVRTCVQPSARGNLCVGNYIALFHNTSRWCGGVMNHRTPLRMPQYSTRDNVEKKSSDKCPF